MLKNLFRAPPRRRLARVYSSNYACTSILETTREPPLRLDGVERCAEAVRDRHGPDAKAVA